MGYPTKDGQSVHVQAASCIISDRSRYFDAVLAVPAPVVRNRILPVLAREELPTDLRELRELSSSGKASRSRALCRYGAEM